MVHNLSAAKFIILLSNQYIMKQSGFFYFAKIVYLKERKKILEILSKRKKKMISISRTVITSFNLYKTKVNYTMW